MKWLAPPLLLLLVISGGWGAEPVYGWRGNGTGLWPEANPPLEWHRTPKGVLAELRAQADKPVSGSEKTAVLVEDGLLTDWLVLGPMSVPNALNDFDREQLTGEAKTEPAAGDKVDQLAWMRFNLPPLDPYAFGEVELRWTDLARAVGGFRPNQIVYAHAYLHTPRGGTVRAVLEHGHGLKARLNGKPIYREPKRAGAIGFYTGLSRSEFDLTWVPSPRFDLELRPGWNRLLFKVASYTGPEASDHRFTLRLQDLPTVEYDSKNIVWMTELSHRSTSTPILVGDRIFVMAEPDELLCIEKTTGRILWSAANNYFEALPNEERKAKPAFADKVDPLIAALKKEGDFGRRIELRHKIQKELLVIDRERFELRADGHFQSHLGIVGYTTPTPVSDGKHVYVWCANGVAACYDLDGKRKWITRLDAKELSYASTPALVDGVLVVFLGKLYGLDAATGKVRWEQPRMTRNVAALLSARLADTPVVMLQRGHVVRASDGKVLYRDRRDTSSGDTGWAPPVILGNRAYVAYYGVTSLDVVDFSDVTGEEWKPQIVAHVETPPEVSRRPNGGWLDRWTAGSPLVVDDIAYQADIYASFYAFDLKAKKMLYRQQTELRGLFHYNAVPVAASPTLVGRHILLPDNQGTTLVLEPGRTFQQFGKNRIATQIDRIWPIPAQETLTYAPPIPDGDRLYIRGERYLYCVGKK